ncbi:hypothetical protein J2045_003359 [Peteryoungia aggregata LMG 23059]|uniref:Transketolase n=1 Tax=Peteryoungia aggregata LMG 23059 TaxID=1368425 RepID=A0ABU0GAD0_9HYPH|nr:hypothetical protein [Peteryoungia aggregata]MDQ0422311.1 hypothetical protein [Peteryoungia aggregata LMG 23059]
MTFNDAHAAHAAADERWMAEIRAAYPREWAGDVRYTDRAQGEEGSPLRAAYEEYQRTRLTFEAALAVAYPSACQPAA